MRINSRSTAKLGVKQSLLSPLPDKGLQRLSSGYRINRSGDGAAVLITQKLQTENSSLPQLIRLPVVRTA